jgi:hypothetical protein
MHVGRDNTKATGCTATVTTTRWTFKIKINPPKVPGRGWRGGSILRLRD